MATETPTAPAQTAAPASPTPAPETPSSASSFDALDTRVTPKPKAIAPKETPKDPKTEPAKEPEKPDAAPKPDATTPAPKVEGPKALRDQLEKRNRELSELETKHRELEKRIADSELKSKDTSVLVQRLADVEKQLQERESLVRELKQEASPEFKEKYEKPFAQAANYAKSQIEGLQMTVEPATESTPAKTTAATWDDFKVIYQMPANKAIPMIHKLFGDTASLVVSHYTELHKRQFEKDDALKEEQAKWGERQTQRESQEAKEREFVQSQWTTINKAIADRKPEWYQPNPQDAEESKILADGYALVDAEPKTMQERIIKDANIRNRAAAFTRMVYLVNKERDKVSELEATIAELRGSEPGKVRTPAGSAPDSTDKDWKTELRESGAIS